MPSSPAKACQKFRPFKNDKNLGDFPDVCTCVWRSGLVHQAGQVAMPALCSSAHQAPSTPLAGWFGAPPAAASSTPRRTSPPMSTGDSAGWVPRKPTAEHHVGKSARRTKTSSKPPTNHSAGRGSAGDYSTRRANAETRSFEHRSDARDYIREYRDRHVLRLVGRDGSLVHDGEAEFGKNLPDPYDFKSDNLRRLYSRLYEYMKRRPKPSVAVGMPIAIERRYEDSVSPAERTPDKDMTEDAFNISDQVQTNYSKFFSPTFRRPKDLTFQPYISGSASGNCSVQEPATLRYSHGTERERSFPSIFRDTDAVQFPMPAYVVNDSGNLHGGERLETPPRQGVASEMDIRLLKAKVVNGSSNNSSRPFTREVPSKKKPNIMSADFDAAMLQFLQKARQNLEHVREQRTRKEAHDRSRLVIRRRNDLAVTSDKARAIRSNTTATDARRINLGVSQS